MTEPSYLLPVWETISIAWEKVKGTKASIWAALILIFLIIGGLAILSVTAKHFLPSLSVAIDIITQVISFLLQMGMLYIGIQRAFDLPVSYTQMFRALQPAIAIRLIGVYLLETLLLIPFMAISFGGYGILVYTQSSSIIISAILMFIGFIGIFYLAFRLSLCIAFVLDKGSNPWQAIKQSYASTRSNIWRIVAVLIIETIILIISVIPLGIGLIWSLPFAAILYGVVYKNLMLNNLRVP